MRFFCDRTGFPCVEIENSFGIGLLPVTKLQFELFLAEPGEPGNGFYRTLLGQNPRVSVRSETPLGIEQFLLTGILDEETQPFCRWVGRGCRLLTATEWRKAFVQLNERPFLKKDLARVIKNLSMDPLVRLLLERVAATEPETWAGFAMMSGGVLEWVKGGDSPQQTGGLGQPHTGFFSTTINPMEDDPVKPLTQERLPYFGLRTVIPSP